MLQVLNSECGMMSSLNVRALTTHSSFRRKFCFFLLLTLFCFGFWYRKSHPIYVSTQWEVLDFRIVDGLSDKTTFQRYTTPPGDINDNVPDPFPNIRSYSAYHQQQQSHERLQNRIQDFIQWKRPNTDHWPLWNEYEDKDYDPNRWEALEREHGIFLNNSIQELEIQGIKPVSFSPYPRYNTEKWKRRWEGEYVPCEGPHGWTYSEGPLSEPYVQGYRIWPHSFPSETIGSAKVLGLDPGICFDRYSRLAPYGMTQFNSKGLSHKYTMWKDIRWGNLQNACVTKNTQRFAPTARDPVEVRLRKEMLTQNEAFEGMNSPQASQSDSKKYKSRTAILIRTWEGYKYKENDIQSIRALISEASLMSGGEYQVFLFVNIKQRNADIYENENLYQELLAKAVPQELRDIAILWTEKVCEHWYPHVGDWQVYWMQFMPVQWFSNQHPQFDYVWNWEIDARYIGNHYHFLERVAEFTKEVPRKHLWERNSRFFFPNLWGGDYEAFLADTDEKIRNSTALGLIDEPIWGPKPYAPFQYPLGSEPPRKAEEDNFEWGVGEEADLITLQPIWDPAETGWSYKNHIWNFIPEVRPRFTPDNGNADGFDHPGFSNIPRRVFINTVARFSKKMLHIMHLENLQGRAMQAEMWPATVALHHGLKAVYAPHPIWTDRKWPAWYAEAVFNANDGIPARWSQQQDSPYNHDREANFGGWSWYYRSVFPHILYRRWLGWKAKDWGWDSEEAKAVELDARKTVFARLGRDFDESEDLRMCLPGMLLHPVKNVYEGADSG